MLSWLYGRHFVLPPVSHRKTIKGKPKQMLQISLTNSARIMKEINRIYFLPTGEAA